MENLTVRQIAENTGVSTQAVHAWKIGDFTPENVAEVLREKARSKAQLANVLNTQSQKMLMFASKLEDDNNDNSL